MDLADILAERDVVVWCAESATLRVRHAIGVAKVLGYRVSAWLDDPDFLANRLIPEERARVLAAWRRAAAGEASELEHGFTDASGRIRRFRSSARAAEASAAEPAELAILMVETAGVADDQIETRELAAMALEDADVLLVGTDGAGRIQVFSGACEALTGRSQAEVRDRPIWELVAHDDERAVLRDAFTDPENQMPRKLVAHWCDAVGDRRVLVWSTRTIVAPGRGVARILFTGVDVTDRERTEAMLRENAAWPEFLLHELPAIVWTVDRSLRFVTTGGTALEGLGLRPGQMEGVSLYTYFHTDRSDHPNIAPTLRALEGETVTFDSEWLGRVFQVVTKPLREPSGEITGAIGLALDVTDRVEAERERDRLLRAERAARAEVEHALEMRDEFVAIASHELSTPMTSLRLAMETLTSGEATGSAADRILAAAARQTAKMTRLVGELLDVTRMRANRLVLQPVEMDLRAVVHEVTSRLEPLARKAGNVFTTRGPSPVLGCWDRARIDQVVSNLIENAIKHAPGAQIVVDVGSSHGQAVLEVSDRGPGISPDRLPRIFDRYERATSALTNGGLGLGLYIVREVVQAHGGEVTVESSPGAGTTFRVCLPRRAPTTSKGPDPSRTASA
jgi:PAS domain S-box-containing protein